MQHLKLLVQMTVSAALPNYSLLYWYIINYRNCMNSEMFLNVIVEP